MSRDGGKIWRSGREGDGLDGDWLLPLAVAQNRYLSKLKQPSPGQGVI
jgi:hypothetical protein